MSIDMKFFQALENVKRQENFIEFLRIFCIQFKLSRYLEIPYRMINPQDLNQQLYYYILILIIILLFIIL